METEEPTQRAAEAEAARVLVAWAEQRLDAVTIADPLGEAPRIPFRPVEAADD
jgi:hypothetical protein